jgi:signal transduction histidine kinase
VRVDDAATGRWVRAALGVLGAAYGLAAVGVATRHGAFTTFAGRSATAAAVELAAGWALVAAGLLTWSRQQRGAAGPLAVAAGIGWFADDWVGWQTGPGGVRIVALAASGVTAAAVVQLALGAPDGALPDRPARAVVAATWAATAAVGIGRVLFYDPLGDPACVAYCAPNPLLLRGDRSLARALDWIEIGVALLAAIAVAALAARRLARADAARRLTAGPIVLAGVGFLAASVARAIALAVDPAADPARPAIAASFAGEAAALIALGGGLARASGAARRGARAIRRLARVVAGEPVPGHLDSALARATGDPSLRVAYPLADGPRWIDGDGRPVAAPARAPGRAVTAILREGRTVAAVVHDPAALDGRVLEREIGTAARLAVDNERLRAEARARLRELRAARVRIVETGDAERRRLERDLHDGAQQRLVSLSVAIGMARGALDPQRAAPAGPRLDAASTSLNAALADLRELAHGIHPVQLSAEGLAAALETLVVRARVAVRVAELTDERLSPAVETAAYVLVDEAVARAERRGTATTITIVARVAGGMLAVDVRDPGEPDAARALADLAGVADRIGALDGRLDVEPAAGGGVNIRAELPCA